MIDYLSLALSHGVLLLAFWRLMLRVDLDTEPAREELANAPAPAPDTSKASLRRA